MKTQKKPLKIDIQLRAQVVSLRRAGMAVSEIGERLGLTRASDLERIRGVCDELPRKYQFGEVAPRGPVTRKLGARR